MENYELYLPTLEKVEAYINWAQSIPFNMDISSGSIHIDGKSILGIFGFARDRELELSVYGHLNEVQKMALAGI